MKFAKIVEEFQKKEENKGKVILARCGVFMVAIGKDAIFLHKVLKLKVTCLKSGICKTRNTCYSYFKICRPNGKDGI